MVSMHYMSRWKTVAFLAVISVLLGTAVPQSEALENAETTTNSTVLEEPDSTATTSETAPEMTPETTPEPPEVPPTTQPSNPLLDSIKEKRNKAADELSAAKLTDAQIADRIEELETSITEKETALKEISTIFHERQQRVRVLERKIIEIEKDVDNLTEIMQGRAVELYMGNTGGSQSSISLLLSSENPTQLEMRRMLVNIANASDDEVRDMLEAKKDDLERVRKDAEDSRKEVEGLKKNAENDRKELAKEKADIEIYRELLKIRVEEIRNEVDALAVEEKALRAILGYPEDPVLDVPTSVERPLSSEGLIWPVEGVFTSAFGMRWGALHAGIDVGAPEGTPVYAAKDGTIIFAGVQGGYGNIVIIDHGDGFHTSYAHLSRIVAVNGSRVMQGELIGLVGNTGNSYGAHLHFETRVKGRPYDPLAYLP
jgi:murein DD-endopeptidase MepM/ murein hydrolase activator NlpD